MKTSTSALDVGVIKKTKKRGRRKKVTTSVGEESISTTVMPQEISDPKSHLEPKVIEPTKKKAGPKKKARGRRRKTDTTSVTKEINTASDIPALTAAPSTTSEPKSVEETEKKVKKRRKRSTTAPKDLNSAPDVPGQTAVPNPISDPKSVEQPQKKERRKRRRKLTNPVSEQQPSSTKDVPQEKTALIAIPALKSAEQTKKKPESETKEKRKRRKKLTTPVAKELSSILDKPQEKATIIDNSSGPKPVEEKKKVIQDLTTFVAIADPKGVEKKTKKEKKKKGDSRFNDLCCDCRSQES